MTNNTIDYMGFHIMILLCIEVGLTGGDSRTLISKIERKKTIKVSYKLRGEVRSRTNPRKNRYKKTSLSLRTK